MIPARDNRSMATTRELPPDERSKGVLFDLLMAVMNSIETWTTAAGDRPTGLAWRDAVTARMIASAAYTPYEDLVEAAARELDLPASSTSALLGRWREMSPWPDAAAIASLAVPYAFVTNTSRVMAAIAARGSGLRPAFVLSAEEAGWYKPDARIYREACRRLGLPPKDTLFVAGAVYDAEAARNADLRAALVLRRPGSPLPDARIRAVTSLDKALSGIERKAQSF
jgi:HAD superfamily hydrolase (TIGR01493 family)